MNKSFYFISLLLIIVGCLITGVSVYYYQNQKIIEAQSSIYDLEDEIEDLRSQLSAVEVNEEEELNEAQETLITFCDLASSEKYEEAAELLAPEVFNAIAFNKYKSHNFQILEYYCDSIGTCLETEVISYEQVTEGHYIFTVKFINSDGSEFVRGLCCGATGEEMPPGTEFEYHVKKIADEYKITTPPLWIP